MFVHHERLNYLEIYNHTKLASKHLYVAYLVAYN